MSEAVAPPAPIPYASLQAGRLIPLEARRRHAAVAVIAYAAVAALAVPLTILMLLFDWEAALDALSPVGIVILVFMGLYLIAMLIALITAAVLFLMWFHGAHANATRMGLAPQRFSTAWAICSWFVPIIHLFHPYLATREILAGSLMQVSHRDVARLRWWWGLWLVSWTASTLSLVLSLTELAPQIVYTAFDLVNVAALLASTPLLLRIMRQITQAQMSSSAASGPAEGGLESIDIR